MASERDNPVTEADLHAFADGQLGAARRTEIERWLEANPVARAEVDEWLGQNAAIRDLFASSAVSRSNDGALIRAASRPRRRWSLMAGAAAACFVVGALAGSVATAALRPSPQAATTVAALLPNVSSSAYLVYAGEVRHPVEVGADQESHLVAWLGKRLDFPLKAPDMSALGYHLVGGRLLPIGDRPGAMFMFENDSGERLTLLVGRSTSNRQTGFRFSTDGPVRTFYWIDGPVGYALSGTVSRQKLEAAAESVYAQLEP